MSDVHKLFDEVQRQVIADRKASALSGSGTDGTYPDMESRVSKLEGQQEGLKQSQNILVMAVGAVSAILIALGVYTVTRLDSLSTQVDALPDQISAKLSALNTTFAQELTAIRAGSQPPTVIVVPQQPPRPAEPTK